MDSTQRVLLVDPATGFYRMRRFRVGDYFGPVDLGIHLSDRWRSLNIGTGLFAGSILPGSNRLVVTGFSPAWRGFYVSSLGGAGLVFDNLGINMVSLVGRAPSPSVLYLNRTHGEEIDVEVHPVDLGGELEGLPPADQLDGVLERLKSLGLVSPSLLVRGLLEVFKGSLRAVGLYEPSLYDGPLHVYRSEKGLPERFSDVDVVVEAPDPGVSWGPYSTHPVTVVTVPGDHITMIWEPHVALLGARMRADIDAVLGEGDGREKSVGRAPAGRGGR